MQLDLFAGDPVMKVIIWREARLNAAYKTGRLEPGCPMCERFAPRVADGDPMLFTGPAHRSPLGHRNHCSCGGCW